jgi:aminomethyltransferase
MSFVSSAFTTATRSSTRSVVRRTLATSSESLVKTSLNDLHKELGADMVPFAGYELPVLYKGENGGVMKEHLWCREGGKSAMFDVSHMGQVSCSVKSCTEPNG